MVILVNPSAGGGRALRRLKKIQPRLRELLGSANLIFLGDGVPMQERVSRMLSEGHTEFIAAGGDGTVNLLLGTIMEKTPPSLLRSLKIGAIGLGSSNDFHKPFRPDGHIAGVPIRIDFDRTVRHDVGHLTFEDDGGASTHGTGS